MGNPFDMREALEKAKNWPRRPESQPARESNIRKALEKLNNSAPATALKRLRADPEQRNRITRERGDKCYQCGQKGHRERDCRNKPAERPSK